MNTSEANTITKMMLKEIRYKTLIGLFLAFPPALIVSMHALSLSSLPPNIPIWSPLLILIANFSFGLFLLIEAKKLYNLRKKIQENPSNWHIK